VRVTLTDEGGAAKTVLLAASPERRGGAPSTYAAVDGPGPVVLVAATALSEVGRSVTELRDRTLIGQLEPKDVKRMIVKARGKSATLERQGESDWRIIEPTKGSAKAAKVEDVLYMARGLKWREIVAAGGEEPGKYGLDTPELEITLARADGGEIATVVVGKRDGDRAFVRTRAAPTIYAIDARQLGETPNVPDDFKS
jgi:hypothetical protein